MMMTMNKIYKKEDNTFYNEDSMVKITGNSFEIESNVTIKSAADAEKWLEELGFSLKDTVKAEYRGEFVIRRDLYNEHLGDI